MSIFTLPLIMHHFDFEFVNPDHKINKPNFTLVQPKRPEIRMKVKTRNPIKP